MDTPSFDVDHPLFSSRRENDVLVLSFKEKPLIHLVDLDEKQVLFDYLDRVACYDKIRVLVIKEATTKMSRTEYIDFYRSMLDQRIHRICLERMNNAVGQLVLKLVNLEQFVVHVDSGKVILLFLNIGLACDYRIVADNTVFQNPNIELDTVPKGGGIFFLSKMQGIGNISRILLSGKDVKASQAFASGIVDKVVPQEMLDHVALDTARSFAALPKSYAIGIKKLINYNYRELEVFLEFENELLKRKYMTFCEKGGKKWNNGH